MQKAAPVYALDFVLHPEQDATYQHFENASANPFQPSAEVSRQAVLHERKTGTLHRRVSLPLQPG
jgi:hypothetical protein